MSEVSDFLYALRNTASAAAEHLEEKVTEFRLDLYRAERVLDELERLADSAERAAEREHEQAALGGEQ